MWNRDRINFTSEFPGVHFNKVTKKWVARILSKFNKRHIGYYFVEEEAGIAYISKYKKRIRYLNYLNKKE